MVRLRCTMRARGAVLEIGNGTGANLLYHPAWISSLTVTEPDPSMRKRLERRVAGEESTNLVLRAPAEDVPFEDCSFDTVSSPPWCSVASTTSLTRCVKFTGCFVPEASFCSESTGPPTTLRSPKNRTR